MRRSQLAGSMLCVLALAACANLPKPPERLSVSLADLQPEQFGLLEQQYAVKIRVQNPNAADAALTGLSYQIELNGKPFAKGVSRQDATVPGFGEVVLEGKAIGSLGGILAQFSALQLWTGRLTYRVTGKLGTRAGTEIPFDHKGKLELPGFLGND